MPTKSILFCLLLASCAGTDTICDMSIQDEAGTGCGNGAEMDALDDPRVRIDGTPADDGVFTSDQEQIEWCDSHQDGWECNQDSELGTSEQAWKSHEYHGRVVGDVACYASAQASGSTCLFPRYGHIKFIFDESACLGAGHDNLPLPPTLAVTRMIAATKAGFTSWETKSASMNGLVTVRDNACGNGTACMTVNVTCGKAGTRALGSADLPTSGTTRVSNLPSGSTGANPGAAKTYESNLNIIIDVWNIWRFLTVPMGGSTNGCGFTSPSNSQIDAMAKWNGAHELGHVWGFNHFQRRSSFLMYATTGCNPGNPASAGMDDLLRALHDYDPVNSGTTVLQDTFLANSY